ncbi:contractile injection system tape measure protein [Marinobacterium sp. YM272]|uniref:contractile injection system tape measure protein n=1 Tax=Marinobacterium sp. YM272 TaxID=3421654 RepID=UPI003D7F94EA
MSRHQVARAHFNLRCQSVPDREQRQHWERLFTERYAPLIERALDLYLQTLDDPGVTLEIDRLQLDLGPLPAPWDEDALVLQLCRQIADQLGSQPAKHDDNSWRLHCYLQFLRWGGWPTGSPFQNAAQPMQWLKDHPEAVRPLIALLRDERKTLSLWQRLAWQHDAEALGWLVACVADLLQSPIPNWQGTATNLSSTEARVIQLWLLCLPGVETSAQPLAEQSTHQLPLGQTDTDRSVGFADTLAHLMRRFGHTDSLRVSSGSASELKRESAQQEVARAGSLVSHAGVILMHPFMADLFRHCGWLDGNRFAAEDARLAALFALHYAATGKQNADEGELTLAKWLVNWPAQQPVPRLSPLEEIHLEEIDACLQAIIKHWSALKNSSVDALREAFLQRNGSLRPQDEGLRLSVESSTLDILLARLPWSLTAVQLPWQPQTLFVDWG